MPSWSALLERGRERNRRHHSHWFPLLRLLAYVNRLCGERFKRCAEAGEHVALLLLCVILLHDGVLSETWTTPNNCTTVPNVGLGLLPKYDTEKSHLTLSARCARPREPISSHQHATEGTDWWLSRGRAADVFPARRLRSLCVYCMVFPVVCVRFRFLPLCPTN